MYKRKNERFLDIPTTHAATFLRGQLGDLVGSGGYGKVYHFSFLQGDQNKLPPAIRDKKWVVKEIAAKKFEVREAQIQSRIYATFAPVMKQSQAYVVTEFIPGHAFFNTSFHKIELIESVRGINLLIEKVRQLHEINIIHGDLKSTNCHIELETVLVEGEEKEKIKSINLLDFGFSLFTNGHPDQLYQVRLPFINTLNAVYMPREAKLFGQFGLKTDIFLLTHLLDELLSFQGTALKKIALSLLNANDLVNRFLSRMKGDYAKRPVITEVAAFFSALEMLCVLFAKTKEMGATQVASLDDEKYAAIAKMILLIQDAWQQQVSSHLNLTWRQFHFEDRPAVCRAMVSLYHQGLLNDKALAVLIQAADAINAVTQCDIHQSFELLATLSGGLQQKRQAGELIISYILKQARTVNEVEAIKNKLNEFARCGKLDFLYKRQGWITFSIHHHCHEGNKTSGTFVKLMTLIERRLQVVNKGQEPTQQVRQKKSR